MPYRNTPLKSRILNAIRQVIVLNQQCVLGQFIDQQIPRAFIHQLNDIKTGVSA